ncbi:uncharacterized protein LOC111639383 [Centruroides sculpturatus]|uniref:uncharacterized protein LOC111639383 n=1 Tax=Centruroides sculpturatus TaxID=218467 RepID=UPI000C6E2653|nr:uncharacterized protein LOC111639383 [Centruroides sculpturatus]
MNIKLEPENEYSGFTFNRGDEKFEVLNNFKKEFNADTEKFCRGIKSEPLEHENIQEYATHNTTQENHNSEDIIITPSIIATQNDDNTTQENHNSEDIIITPSIIATQNDDNTTQENHNSEDIIITPSIIATQNDNLTELSDTPVQTRRSLHPKRSRVDQKSLTNEILLTVNDHFKKPHVRDDRFDIFGKNVAMKLRGLPKQQMLIAEKLINETLFQAEMGNLNCSHKLMYEQPHLPHQFIRYQPPISTGFGIINPSSSTFVEHYQE